MRFADWTIQPLALSQKLRKLEKIIYNTLLRYHFLGFNNLNGAPGLGLGLRIFEHPIIGLSSPDMVDNREVLVGIKRIPSTDTRLLIIAGGPVRCSEPNLRLIPDP